MDIIWYSTLNRSYPKQACVCRGWDDGQGSVTSWSLLLISQNDNELTHRLNTQTFFTVCWPKSRGSWRSKARGNIHSSVLHLSNDQKDGKVFSYWPLSSSKTLNSISGTSLDSRPLIITQATQDSRKLSQSLLLTRFNDDAFKQISASFL